MEGDNWKDETLPGRRVGSDRSAADEDVRRDRLAITVRVLGSIVVLLALTLCGLWSLYLLRGRAVYVGPTPTSVVWTPTSASISIASPHPPSAEMNKPSPTASLEIVIGSYVRVEGTGGDGLNLRAGPSKDFTRLGLALEGELFIVVDGPIISGDSKWWKIRDPENGAQEWWTNGDFLEPVERP